MIFESTVPQFIKMLNNLTAILDKAAAFADSKKIEVEVLLNSRLAPDMFHCTKQIQIACDAAKFTAARLTGQAAPSFEDNEKTFGEVKERIQKTIKYLQTFKPEDFSRAADRRVTQARWEGKTLSGAESVAQVSLPNFYFHLSMAYAILRHNGVEVGKSDYLGQLPLK
jgi:uncharacterized protein